VTWHSDTKFFKDEVVETVRNPDLIVGDIGELRALKFYSEFQMGPKYLVFVYRENLEERLL
jgi:hypothetical protein